jgi:hypothetical protein
LYSYNKDQNYISAAKDSIDYCLKYQNPDGSWYYGVQDNQRWIDSFHTGYNLEALHDYQAYTGDSAYRESFEKGLAYYLAKFFTDEGLPKYYNNKIYPIDPHSCAQLVVLLSKAGLSQQQEGLIDKVLGWTVYNMQDKAGWFYYQKSGKYSTIKIPYMRWVCSWMFYAFSHYIRAKSK